jgi:hypothetical protein
MFGSRSKLSALSAADAFSALLAPKIEWYHRLKRDGRCRFAWEACMAEGENPEEAGQDKGKPTIKVTDRRHFTLDGERRTDVDDDSEPVVPQPAPQGAGPARRPAEEPRFEHRPLDEPEGVDFTMLINAMAQPALLYLGEIPHPATGQPTLDLEGARIQIDMLDLLRVKCRGNLTPQEDNLLESVLHQLRMRYVARTGSAG